MNPCRIAILAKAPLPGLAKTRLAPALGEVAAAALAARLLAHAVAQAATASLGPVTLWATPDALHPAFTQAQQRHAVTLAVQPDGDLGVRMARVFEDGFVHGGSPILLMGTDAPDLNASVLRQAAAALQWQHAVFVPALDGGYALVGLRASPPSLLHAVFSGMWWSTPHVMAQTRQRLAAAGIAHAKLPSVADIDEPADLQHLPAAWLDDARSGPPETARQRPGNSQTRKAAPDDGAALEPG